MSVAQKAKTVKEPPFPLGARLRHNNGTIRWIVGPATDSSGGCWYLEDGTKHGRVAQQPAIIRRDYRMLCTSCGVGLASRAGLCNECDPEDNGSNHGEHGEHGERQGQAEPTPDTRNPIPSTDYSARNCFTFDTLPLSQITPSPDNPRSTWDTAGLQDLARSLREHGLLQPIVVRTDGEGYRIIAGERRYRAAKLAGWRAIPVIIRECEDAQALVLSCTENLKREDLNPIDRARALQAMTSAGVTQTEIATKIESSQPAVANALRLLDLPEPVQKLLQEGKLTQAHGIALARWKQHPEFCQKLAAEAVRTGATTKQLEEKLPFRNEMVNKNAVVRFYGSTFPECKNCPYDAYLTVSQYETYCLRPAHHAELTAQKRKIEVEQRQRDQEKCRKLAEGDGTKPLELAKDHTLYRLDQSYNRKPACCSEKCDFYQIGRDRDGSLVPVCTNEERRHEELATEDAAEKERKTEAAEEMRRSVKALVDAEEGLHRAMAVLGGMVMCRFDLKLQRAAAEHLALEPPGKKDSERDYLNGLSLLNIIRYTCLLAVEDELRGFVQYNWGKKTITDWLLSGICSTCGLPPKECMCAEVAARGKTTAAPRPTLTVGMTLQHRSDPSRTVVVEAIDGEQIVIRSNLDGEDAEGTREDIDALYEVAP